MSHSFIRSCFILGAVTASHMFVDLAYGEEGEASEIPTQLSNSPDGEDLNGPCSLCRVHTIKVAETATEDGATLELYYDDDSGPFLGSIVLTILLDSGQSYSEVIDGIQLQQQETLLQELGPREDWSWTLDVKHIWVEAFPGA